MTEIKIQLSNADLKTLEETAQQEDKTLDEFIQQMLPLDEHETYCHHGA